MMHIRLCNCRIKDLDNIYVLSLALAQYFPRPEQFVTGIHELLLNAVEHGNLGIGFDEKTELIRKGKWKQEIARRLDLPENINKEVHVTLAYDQDECRLIIADQGSGFPWREFVDRQQAGKKPNGRGLWIALNSSFDQVQFNHAGNEVTCVARYQSDRSTAAILSLS